MTVSLSLRNDGDLRLDEPQTVTTSCPAELEGCRHEITLVLLDGYSPDTTTLTIRAPMGTTTLEFGYGDDHTLQLDVAVPERIIGVGRDLWECYSHRPEKPLVIAGEHLHSCGGWESPTVRKWVPDGPVKAWASGDYIDILSSVLAEQAPVLGMEFEWVDSKEEADFRAYVGVPRSQAEDIGYERYVQHGGVGGASRERNGWTTAGHLIVWKIESWSGYMTVEHVASAIIAHETLHALVPMSHSTRPGSIMGGSGFTILSPRDKELIRFNTHRLVRPGMTMDEVRSVIVLDDELLDGPLPFTQSTEPADLIWRAYAALYEAGTASFRLSGGWQDANCSHLTFGQDNGGPVELEIGSFRTLKDKPALVHLNLKPGRFFQTYSHKDREWRYWQHSGDGAWKQVEAQVLGDATYWWVWAGKLHKTIRSLIKDGVPPTAVVTETADGNLILQAMLEPSTHRNLWNWEGRLAVDFTLVVDRATSAIEGYTWGSRPCCRAGVSSDTACCEWGCGGWSAECRWSTSGRF